MYRNLFTAWYCLCVIALCLVTFFSTAPFIGWERARGGFGFLGLLGLLPFFWFVVFRSEKNDERDVSFLQRAVLAGMSNGFAVMLAINGIFVFLYRSRLDSLPFDAISVPSQVGIALATLVTSVMLLLFYYQGENADKENNL